MKVPVLSKEQQMVPNKLLMGPGPANCNPAVISALSNPLARHDDSFVIKIMREITTALQYLFQTSNAATFCITGTGNAAFEAALCNLIEDDDIVLIAITGFWGHRAVEISLRHGATVRTVQSPTNSAFTLEEITAAMEQHKPKIFFIVHGESSVGVLQPQIKEMGALCRRHNCLFVVDTVCTLGGVEFYMDDWQVDVAFTASQKILGAPSGLSAMSLSERAMSQIRARKTKVKSFYLDILLNELQWNSKTDKYHHTLSSTQLCCFHRALANFCEKGLQESIERRRACALRLQKGLQNLGLKLYVPNPEHRLPTLTTVEIPSGMDEATMLQYAYRKHNVTLVGGAGPTTGKVFRIGLMGENGTTECVDLVLNIMNEALQKIRSNEF